MASGQTYEGLIQAQIDQFSEAFSIIDKPQTGLIPVGNFGELWRSIGQNPTEKELKEIIAANEETNETGQLDLDTFLRICESDNPQWLKDPLRPEELIEAFKEFDKDGKGSITIPQLRYMLQCLGDKLDDQDADDFVNSKQVEASKKEQVDPEAPVEIDYEKLVWELFERNPLF
eukprot:TRINITY_DN12673_c0_g1_i1.p2 TRINITY_DN12673_c0_g1~~TRINITY_DN12673_c0_g1_i1.p2  ORF type:complete len:174 (-),score=46.94 TRINITY_DN12673_c0_g1_i1:111-632(-)